MIIAGMHRSGTSFFTRWMKDSGLFVGDNLAGATPSNLDGHFEDLEIVTFHEQLLRHNNTTMYCGHDHSLEVPDIFYEQAKSFTEKRNLSHKFWGWKQPRATLFLDLWYKVNPKAHFVFMVRHPETVINSLLRRESYKPLYKVGGEEGQRIRTNYLDNIDKHSLNYSNMFIRHTRDIVNFIKQYGDELNYSVFAFESILDNHESIVERLKDEGFQLDFDDPRLYHKKSYQVSKKEYLIENEEHINRCKSIYNELLSFITFS